MKRIVFLDDIRMPEDVFKYTSNPIYNRNNWIIVRNYNEFIQEIQKNGIPDLISWDHDLADEHYAPEMYDPAKYNKLVFQEKTGYDCAKWLVEHIMDNDLKLPHYLCHSMNPAGKINIMSLLNNFKKLQG